MMRHAFRSLRRTPVFTTTAIITLALGIGSVAAMFAVVHGVLLAPLPFGDPNRLVTANLGYRSPELRRIEQPGGVPLTYQRFARTISDIGYYRTGSGNIWVRTGVDEPERVTSTWISANLIPTLRVTPLLGRTFTADEDRASGANAVILSERVWRERFQGAHDVLGKTLIVNSLPRQVVGVMPERFRFPDAETQVWLPARVDQSTRLGESVGDFTWSAVARLAPGATPEAAARELASVLPRVAELYPRLGTGTSTAAWLADSKPAPIVMPFRDELTSGIAGTLWVLAAAAGLVLLVACANVANLMLIRGDGRQLELAVREALGASRLRIVTHFLGEALVLAGVAGVIGTFGAWAAVQALVAFGPADVPRIAELTIGPATIGFILVVSLLAAALCSIVPAFRIRRGNLSINLRDGGRSDTAGKTRQRLRAGIAALQIAVALVVLAGSALLLRTFRQLYNERPGFDANNVLTVWTQLPFARYGDSSAIRFHARFTAAVAQLPGVRAVGLTTKLPLGTGEIRQQSFSVVGTNQELSLPVNVVDDGYFGAMKIPLLAGHGFQATNVQQDGELVISRRAAATIWKDPTGQASIGKTLTLMPSGPTYTVIGVAGDVRDHDLATPPASLLYIPQAYPLSQVELRPRRSMALVVRTSGNPAAVSAGIRQIVRGLDPTVPTFDAAPMTDVVRASTARLSLMLTLMSAAAVVTLILGAIGLYGVIAYMVALRTREFGIRVALGADPAAIARTVTINGLRLIGGGIAVGLVLYAWAAPSLRAFLYGVTPSDPLTLTAAVLILGFTASLANWVPARRAARVDAAEALRAE
jgi:predicted permease